MHQWRKSLYEGLRGFTAPRVLSFAEIVALSEKLDLGVSPRSVRQFVADAEQVGVLTMVRKGLWINQTAIPAPSAAEAAGRIRSGAVVSLQTVLGDAGVLNNFSSQVYAIIPNPPSHGANVGSVTAAGTTFHFRTIPNEVLEAGDEGDRLSSLVAYPRATAEAALIHWLYLARSRGSSMGEPDTQCDVDLLDIERVERLGRATGLYDRAFDWIDRCRERMQDEDERQGWAGP